MSWQLETLKDQIKSHDLLNPTYINTVVEIWQKKSLTMSWTISCTRTNLPHCFSAQQAKHLICNNSPSTKLATVVDLFPFGH
jgi:hypothetical protein